MFGIVLTIALAVALVAILRAGGELTAKRPFGAILLAGYGLRPALEHIVRTAEFFSHGAGFAGSIGNSDADGYEIHAHTIAVMWQHVGIHFVTTDEFPELGPTVLPPNIFALVIYINDGVTTLGCMAVVAFAAALTVLNIYKLALQFGATERSALLMASLLYFDPAFLHYTSDTFKDGLVACFTIGALGSAIRLSYKASVLHAIIGLVCISALWYVRFYLVFVTVAPLVVGVVGLGSRSAKRPFIAALAIACALVALVAFTDMLQIASERASETFERATSSGVLQANAIGGSGVEFDDGGSPFRALPQKLAYALFAPFLWASGSLGFQVAKLDSIIWYFIMYRAARAAPRIDQRLLILLLTFIVPCVLMYAMAMANVGLVVRQRLVIVAATVILAALYQRKSSPAVGAQASRGHGSKSEAFASVRT